MAKGRVGRFIESRMGLNVVPSDRLTLLEQAETDRRVLARELDRLGYTALNFTTGRPQDMPTQRRRLEVQKARYAWMTDPLAGAAVTKLNEFVFGRGVPKPTAKDPQVQEVIDEFWSDPDNERVLTSFQAQVELGIDLQVQDNLFLLMFDDGDDGKVKLGLVNHDTVEDVVTDPDNRLRVLYYYTQEKKVEWDFKTHTPKADPKPPDKRYYRHWQNVEIAEEEEDRDENVPKPPGDLLAEGKVYHLATNKGMEQHFGVPSMRRTLRWYSALNEMMASRVDMAKAAAAFIMQRKIKGTPNQLQKMATKAISLSSELGAARPGIEETGMVQPPRPGSIANTNEATELEPFKLDSGSAGAQQDAQMIRAQISAASGWPQSYLGDESSSSLGTSTALELPVLKMVESRQEVFEAVFRWAIDRVIERAVETGRISEQAEPEQGTTTEEELPAEGIEGPQPQPVFAEAHEDKGTDEADTKRDLGYEFSMPSPLRRMMTDLVTAVQSIAQTFDPNNTNTELSRVLLGVVFGEALEIQDPQELVDRIFPEGYVDPAIAAAQAAAQQQQGPPQNGNFFGPESQGLPTDLPTNPENPYGVPARARPPEALRSPPYDMQHAAVTEGGDLDEMKVTEMPDDIKATLARRKSAIERLWQEDVVTVAQDRLLTLEPSSNGKE